MLNYDDEDSARKKETQMKTYLVIAVVIAAHCLAVGSVFLIQGCGTTMATTDEVPMEPTQVVMPPSAHPDPQPATVLVPPSSRPHAGAADDPVNAQMITYTVKKGDSLSGIAHRHGISVAEAAALNGIKNPNMIQSGQRLLLPSGAAKRAAVAKTVPRKPAGRPAGNEYVVKKGDSLSAIAFEYGTSVSALKEANGLTSDMIMAGQELVIPPGR